MYNMNMKSCFFTKNAVGSLGVLEKFFFSFNFCWLQHKWKLYPSPLVPYLSPTARLFFFFFFSFDQVHDTYVLFQDLFHFKKGA